MNTIHRTCSLHKNTALSGRNRLFQSARRRLVRILRGSAAGALFGLAVSLCLTGCPTPAPTLPQQTDDATESQLDGTTVEMPGVPSPQNNNSDTADKNENPQKKLDGTKKEAASETTSPPEKRPDNPVRSENAPMKHLGQTRPDEHSGNVVSKQRKEVFFQGWESPRVVLAITGEQHGYIEPCGCTGLENQRGGLARRYTLFESVRARGWDLVPVDTGNQIRRFGTQAEIKFQSAVAGMRKMGYQAVALGPNDLRLSSTMLAGMTIPTGSDPPLFFGGSAMLFGDESFIPPISVVKGNGLRIAMTSIIAKSRTAGVNNQDVSVEEVSKAVKQAATRLAQANADWSVLIIHGSTEESQSLVKGLSGIDLVVCSGEPGEPMRAPVEIDGSDAKMILVGDKGMHVGFIGLYGDRTTKLRYQRVPLDASYSDAKSMLQLLADYQNTLKLRGLKGLGVQPVAHESGRKFVGSAACDSCHDEAFVIWKEGVDGNHGPHSHATESLVHPGERSGIPRHYDPECLSCHVTGWNPTQYYPYESGYLDLERSKHLTGNGCENCHGPGSKHVAAENGEVDADDKTLEVLRLEMKITLDGAENRCMVCHDLDNSPDFHDRGAFKEYWSKIRH